MASTSSERPSSSCSISRLHYDVFISFRGEDTRYDFTNHLYTALLGAGIFAFRDGENLQRGETIDSELTKAIEGFQGQIVLPVFYHVDPSDVRNHTGPFAINIAHGPSVNDERIQKWRDALRLVGHLAGWHLNQRDLVGMESSGKEMMDLVNKRLKDVLFIGIWGVGGVGKTTLAEIIYCKISQGFYDKSFIYFKHDTETGNLVSYQNEVLKHIFKREFDITCIYKGKQIIKKMLCGRKVLIALDNVSEKGQLDAIVGSHDWFGQGSIIIITSEDKQLLVTHDVDDIYEVKPLDNSKALELFSWNAFKQAHPENDFVDLSNDFVKHAQGLSLALECFGSFLHNKEIDVWKSYLCELEENSEGEILTKLEIIYKRILDRNVKELFLDIAFFFKGMDKNRVANILNDPSYLANLAFLPNNSLITIFQGKL
ncbi:disease resistance protein Roq1-like [Castanea sativa]|uniref:disease resistance protein Roq1-like n=1 Tax=Castanea sativa TaxID=21020 RepID=UPI003F649ABE